LTEIDNYTVEFEHLFEAANGKSGKWPKWQMAKVANGKSGKWQKWQMAKMATGKSGKWQNTQNTFGNLRL
jgi:hypothetical protein